MAQVQRCWQLIFDSGLIFRRAGIVGSEERVLGQLKSSWASLGQISAFPFSFPLRSQKLTFFKCEVFQF